MPYIRVNLQKMQHTSETLQKIGKDLEKIEESFRHVSARLDWDIKREQDIDWMLRNIANELKEEGDMLKSMKSFLDYAIDRYDDLDQQTEHNGSPVIQIFQKFSAIGKLGNLATVHSDLLDRAQKIIEGFSKLIDNSTGEFSSDILKYCNDLIQLFSGGDGKKMGIVRWCDLADSSCSLWKGFYEILRDGFQDDKIKKQFEDHFGIGASAIGLIGSYSGFFGSFIQYYFTKDRDDYADCVKSLVDAGKESYLALAKPDSNYSAHTYTSIIQCAVDFSAQLEESVQKYSRDGKWSMVDTGATGIEASITGLNTLISKYTYGAISLENIGTSPEKVSETTIEGAKNWGTAAGEMILNDPKLRKEYEEANAWKKKTMLFWAIGKTGIMSLAS